MKVNVAKIEETIVIEFKEPMPKLDYTTEITNSVTMIKEGLSYREKEVKRLSPYMSEEEVNQVFFEYGVDRHKVGSKEVVDAIDPSIEDEPTDVIVEEESPVIIEEEIPEEEV
jgi:hypothetical protein